MRRYYSDGTIPTLDAALIEHMNADDLKKLAKHTHQISTRKYVDKNSAFDCVDRPVTMVDSEARGGARGH
jgi:hypothetical protein